MKREIIIKANFSKKSILRVNCPWKNSENKIVISYYRVVPVERKEELTAECKLSPQNCKSNQIFVAIQNQGLYHLVVSS